MRLRHNIELSLKQEGGNPYQAFERGEDAPPTVSDVFTAFSSGTLRLPETQEAVNADLGQVIDCRGLYIEADSAIVAFVNGSSLALNMVPSESSNTCSMLIEAKIKSLVVQSASPGKEANCVFSVWGYSSVQDDSETP